MRAAENQAKRSFGMAWVGLCAAFGLHVVDEALTDFLSFYNPAVQSLRRRLPLVPLPTFTFEVWIALLILAVAVLTLLSPWAFRGAWGLRIVAYPFGVIMLLNGVLHSVASLYLGRLASGVYSSPLLVAASLYLLLRLRATGQ